MEFNKFMTVERPDDAGDVSGFERFVSSGVAMPLGHGPRLISGRYYRLLPDTNSLRRRQVERLPGVHLEGVVPRVEIAHGVGAVLIGRVAVDGDPAA
jgi:hypothetical protein